MSDPVPGRRREPVFNMPGAVLFSCIVLLAVHGLRGLLSYETDDTLVAFLAFVPARLAIALGIAHDQLRIAVQHVPQETFEALIGSGSARWWTLLTYALLHGSWAHVGFNCVWLVAFGAPVARRFGALRFFALLAVAAVAGAVVQFFADPASFVPVIGASAAVSGAMGAATRFVFRAPTETLRPLADRDDAFRQPALTLRQTFTTRNALVFIVFWFVTNTLFGLYPALSGVSDGPIAWQAHMGGFLAGLLLFRMFDPARPAPILEREDSAQLPVGLDE